MKLKYKSSVGAGVGKGAAALLGGGTGRGALLVGEAQMCIRDSGQMLEQGKISQEEYDEAVAQELVFVGSNSESGQSTSDIYSWYEEQVITDVMNDLKEEYGYSSQYVSQMLSNGGLRIYTCVDLSLIHI